MLKYWGKCRVCGHMKQNKYEAIDCANCGCKLGYVQDKPDVDMDNLTVEDKAELYDELTKWYWWLDRRRKGGWAIKLHFMTYITETSLLFPEYKEES